MKIVITGVSGKLGRMVAWPLEAQGHTIYGIDQRPWPDAPEGVEMFREDIRKRPAEDVFRTRKPDALIHMGTITHFVSDENKPEKRNRINLRGTKSVFEYCDRWGVEKAIFVGRHTFYGAAPDSPFYHTEEDPPMAVTTFPELADLVAADLFALSTLWRYPNLQTTVLRLCYTIGPSRRGTLADYLKAKRVPSLLGYDPLYQFMHERDASQAIQLALENNLQGAYNVAGPQPLPLSMLIDIAGGNQVAIPESLFGWMTGRFGVANLPPGAKTHIKYPVVVDDSRFREATGYEHNFDEIQTLESFRWS